MRDEMIRNQAERDARHKVKKLAVAAKRAADLESSERGAEVCVLCGARSTHSCLVTVSS